MTSEHHQGRRAHRVSPAVQADDWGSARYRDASGADVPLGPGRSLPRGPRDPFLTRLGVLVAAGVLLAPLAAALKGDNDVPTGAASNAAIAIVEPADLTDADDTAAPADTAADGVQDPTTSASAAPQQRRARIAAAPSTAATTAPSTAARTPASTTSAPATTAAQSPVAQVGTTAPPACALTYTARAGDFWIGIADRAGVELRQLLMANGATAATALFPGDDVCIPAGGRNPGPPPTTTPPTTTAPTTAAPTTTRPPSPTTTRPPSTTQPPTSYTQQQVIAIIREVWPDHLEDKAIEIAWRESNHIPRPATSAATACSRSTTRSTAAGWRGSASPRPTICSIRARTPRRPTRCTSGRADGARGR